MKKWVLLLITIISSLNLLAQSANTKETKSYPFITIKDIQYQDPDSLLINGDQPSPYEGDTVTVEGVVMVAPYMGANPDSSVIMYMGNGACGLYLQDPNDPEWGGILLRQNPAASPFNVLDTGYVIKVTGYVKEYSTSSQKTTQLNVINFDESNVVNIQPRPAPVELTLEDLNQIGTGTQIPLAEKYEGVYVIIRNVTTFGKQSNGSFSVINDNGTTLSIGVKSDYFYQRPAPIDGTKLEYIRGFIETRTDGRGITLNPAYRNDVKIGKFPPFIFNVRRDLAEVSYGDSVKITTVCRDNDGSVTDVKVMYSVNDAPFDSLTMVAIDDTTYSAVIPAQNDSALVAYYIKATDDENNVSTNPGNPNTNLYFYFVLNRPLTIQDVQYSPFGGGYSAYNNFDVTVTGVVTADTSDVEGDGGNIGPKVYIQNGSGPWSGIWLFGTEALKLSRGEKVQVTGRVRESYGVTRIEGLDSPSSITVLGTEDIPAAYELSTADISNSASGSLPAESFESVLIKYSNITVVDENADGDAGPNGTGNGHNYGEMYIADNSGVRTRVELQDGTHDYHNFWDASLDSTGIRIRTNDTFSSLTGILFYSHGNYKLVPRKNDDFEGHITSAKNEEYIPKIFGLSQNYPNPFNPSTIIEYSIPKETLVKLEIYNIIGEKVVELVNAVQSAGIHRVNFDASRLSSGVYLYKLTAGNNFSVKKMMLLK